MTDPSDVKDSRPKVAMELYGGYPGLVLTGGSVGMPSGGGGAPPPREALMMPPRYCVGGFGEVADETEEESKDLVDKFGDRAKEGCDGAAMMVSYQTTVSRIR